MSPGGLDTKWFGEASWDKIWKEEDAANTVAMGNKSREQIRVSKVQN